MLDTYIQLSMKNLIISAEIEAKLRDKHQLRRTDVEQAFMNRDGNCLIDTREQHLTDPLTEWFVAENDKGQQIKVAFVPVNGKFFLRTAYVANPDEIRIYNKFK
jgi:hypothetical protein